MNDFDGMDWAKHYRERIAADAHLPELPVRDRPCDDCAVVFGLYAPFTEGLSTCSIDTQDAVAAKWDCHQTPRRACRGNVNMLATIRRRSAGTATKKGT